MLPDTDRNAVCLANRAHEADAIARLQTERLRNAVIRLDFAHFKNLMTWLSILKQQVGAESCSRAEGIVDDAWHKIRAAALALEHDATFNQCSQGLPNRMPVDTESSRYFVLCRQPLASAMFATDQLIEQRTFHLPPARFGAIRFAALLGDIDQDSLLIGLSNVQFVMVRDEGEVVMRL
jgi:hypothetical protein